MTLEERVKHYTHHRKQAERCGVTAIRDKFELSSSGRAHDIATGKIQHEDSDLIMALYADHKWHVQEAGTTMDIAEEYDVPRVRVQKMVQRERGSL